MSTLVFDRRQRQIVSDAIRGVRTGTVAVDRHSTKIRERLLEQGIDLARKTIHQQLFWYSNKQETYRAAFAILQDERPRFVEELLNGDLAELKNGVSAEPVAV